MMTRTFDVPCFFGRDISKFRDFACAWYGADLQSDRTPQSISFSFANPKVRVHEKTPKKPYPTSANPNVSVHGKPPKILYPTDFMRKFGGEQKRLIDEFVKDLESALGVKRKIISLAKEWEASAPENLAKQGLQDYMQNVCTSLPNHPLHVLT